MRKAYTKPSIEIELYSLDQSIAANCTNIRTWGPRDYAGSVCKEFQGDDDIILGIIGGGASIMSTKTSFYNGTTGPVCDCYYTSGGEGYFTS